MGGPTFLLDTNIAYSSLGHSDSSIEHVKTACKFISRQRNRQATLIVSPFARIELIKNLLRVHSGRAGRNEAASADLARLSSGGVEINSTLNPKMDQKSFFEYATQNVAECDVPFGDALLAAEAALTGSTLITFDEEHFKKVHTKQRLNWFNPANGHASSSAARHHI